MAKTSVSKPVKTAMMKRDGGRCQIGLPGCSGAASGPDHRAGRGAGGSIVLNGLSNLLAACWSCNWQKETVHGEIREQLVERGVIVMKAATNQATALRALETPFVDLAGIAWLLDDDGGKERA